MPASSVYAFASSELYSPRSIAGMLAFSASLSGGWLPQLKRFHTMRFACQGFTYFSCSGKRFGSAAAVNASSARIADAVWCPCPPPSFGKRVIITSGRKLRTIQTTSESTASLPHFAKLSSGLFEKPKSTARVKNCSALSMFLAASNS